MARLHTGRHKVITTYRSYHGNTATAIQMTGDPRRWPNDGGATGVVHFFGPYPYRSPFWSRAPEQECERALEHLEQVVAFEGPGTIAAIVLETIPGTAGILVPPDGYLAGVREICDRNGIVYIADEVMAGFGRAGEWFAVDKWDVRARPDHVREGLQLRLRAARRGDHLRPDRRDLRRAGVPRRADLLRPPARLRGGRREHDRDARRGHHRQRPRRSATTCSAQACARSPSGTRASVRCAGSASSGRSTWSRTRDPRDARALQRHRRANAPMAELVAACKSRGPAAVHQLQPAARRAALHDLRGRGEGGPGDPRRGLVVADAHATA